jgi:ornithine carbamoyltransferase
MIAQPFADMLNEDGGFLSELIELALRIKREPKAYASALAGRVLYGLYQKTSTRTHLSFGKAMATLGGTYIWQNWNESNFSISDVESEAKYVSTTADAIVARLLKYATVLEFCDAAEVPFINGCCDRFHPTQAVADCMTLVEALGDLRGRKIVYAGVFNNILNSLALALPQLGAELVALAPIVNPASRDERVLAKAMGTGRFKHLTEVTAESMRAELADAAAVYLDTWIDMEVINDPNRASEKEARIAAMLPLQLNPYSYGNSKALIMHAHTSRLRDHQTHGVPGKFSHPAASRK